MNKVASFKNFVFISYSHADKKSAEELQKVLDEFHLPVALKEKYPDRPEILREIFRDDTGLPAGSNLTKEIQKQLDQSNYLVVICSPNAVKSQWVNKEIEYFKIYRDPTHIIPFIIEGVANAKEDSDEECFPSALKSLEARGANISTFSFERAVIEVIAGALVVDVDDLWQRHVRAEEERKRKLQEQRDNLLRIQSRFLSEKANALVDEGDAYTARLLALEALPKDLENPDRPYVPEAEAVFRRALSYDTKVLGGNGKRVRFVVVSPDGKMLFSLEGRDELVIYDIATGRIKKSLDGRGCINISFTQDGWIEKHMENGEICILNPYHFVCCEVKKRKVANNDMRHKIYGTHEKTLSYNTPSGDFEVRIDGTYIYVKRLSCTNNEIIHPQKTKNIQKNIQKKSNIVWETYSCDGEMRVVSKKDYLEIYDSRNKRTRKFGGFHGRFYPLAFSEEGMRKIYKMEDLRLLQSEEMIEDGFQDKYFMDELSDLYPGFHFVTFSNGGKYIASASQDCTIRIFNTKNLELECLIKTNKVVGRLSFNNESSLIASLSDKVQIWDKVTGVCLQTFDCCEERAISVNFENNKVCVEYSSGTIQIWDYPPLQELIDESRKRVKDNSLTPEKRKKYYLD